MNKIDRLTGIILALRARGRTASELAERFEVSRRTILRDIDALSQIGVPLIAEPGPGGGIRLPDDYHLPPPTFSVEETTALLIAANAFATRGDGPLPAAARSAIEKLREVLNASVLAAADRSLDAMEIDAARPRRRLAYFAVVRQVIADGSWLTIDYASLRRQATHLIYPTALIERDGRWLCSAISHEAGESRSYRLNRITAAAAADPPPDAEEVIERATRPRQPYDDLSHPLLRVRLTHTGARLAEDLPHLGHLVVPTSDRHWEVSPRCPPSELPYYAREFLGFGPHALVMEPDDAREMVRRLLEETLEI